MAVGKLMKDTPPDLILSGVNRGANIDEDVTYSGTVSAAMEGTLAGFRSIALSPACPREGMADAAHFACAEAWGEKVWRPLPGLPMLPRTLLNIIFTSVASNSLGVTR